MSQSLPANDTQSIAPLVIQMLQAGLNMREMERATGVDQTVLRSKRDALIVALRDSSRTFAAIGKALNMDGNYANLIYLRNVKKREQRTLPWESRPIEGVGYFSAFIERILLRSGLVTLGRIYLTPDRLLLKIPYLGVKNVARILEIIEAERLL